MIKTYMVIYIDGNLEAGDIAPCYRGNISSRLSEANVSELPESLEEMFPWYYMHIFL